jgi:hypothetical protein
MISKIKPLIMLFRKGKVVADPAAWKAGQITSTALVAFIWALVEVARAFGYEIPIDSDSADGIAVGIIAAVNLVLTITTSDKVGV